MNQIRLLTAFLSALWLSFTGPAFGNGGVFDLSVVRRTGDLVPVQKRSISLEKEDLYVRIEEDDATVDVAYELLNHGSSTQ